MADGYGFTDEQHLFANIHLQNTTSVKRLEAYHPSKLEYPLKLFEIENQDIIWCQMLQGTLPTAVSQPDG